MLTHIRPASALNNLDGIKELLDVEKPATSKQPNALTQFSNTSLAQSVINGLVKALICNLLHRGNTHESYHIERVISHHRVFRIEVALSFTSGKLFVPDAADLPRRMLPKEIFDAAMFIFLDLVEDRMYLHARQFLLKLFALDHAKFFLPIIMELFLAEEVLCGETATSSDSSRHSRG